MVVTVPGAPRDDAVLPSGRAQNGEDKAKPSRRLVRAVRKQPVVTDRDAQASSPPKDQGGDDVRNAHGVGHGKPRHQDQSRKRRENEKGHVGPYGFFVLIDVGQAIGECHGSPLVAETAAREVGSF